MMFNTRLRCAPNRPAIAVGNVVEPEELMFDYGATFDTSHSRIVLSLLPLAILSPQFRNVQSLHALFAGVIFWGVA